MPYSNGLLDKEICQYISNKYNDVKILDVGPGAGKWGHFLNAYHEIDAVEVFKPYIRQFNLEDIYDNVFNDNIVNQDVTGYDIVIMGDVLEHLSIEDAKKVVQKVTSSCEEIIVVVPYSFEQKSCYENKYEEHIQNDLTKELMEERYPELKFMGEVDVARGIGWYVKKC